MRKINKSDYNFVKVLAGLTYLSNAIDYISPTQLFIYPYINGATFLRWPPFYVKK